MARRKGRAITDTVGIAPVNFPTGCVLPYAGSTAPDGWILCSGQAVSRTTFAALFSVIGTTYGVGDGSTTFNLPDYRGRVPVGKDDMGGTPANRMTTAGAGVNGASLGAAGGSQTHTIVTAEMPSHTHTQNAHTHTQNAHNHSQNFGLGANAVGGAANEGVSRYLNGSALTGGTAANSNISEIATNQNSTPTNNNTGGGTAHQNTQPSIIANYILKV